MPQSDFPIQLVDCEPISFYKKYKDTEQIWDNATVHSPSWRRTVTLEIINMLLAHHGMTGWKGHLNTRIYRGALGRTHYKKKLLEMTDKMITCEGTRFRTVMSVIKHELAHVLTPWHVHDNVWKAKSIELGSDGERLSWYVEWVHKSRQPKKTKRHPSKSKPFIIDLS
jgi:hypothetical protein